MENYRDNKENRGFSLRYRLKSFGNAFKGLFQMIRSQHNFRIHIAAGLFALAMGIVLKISVIEWILIVMVIGMVFTAEAFNTAIEEVVDLISPEKSERAGRIKDISAAAVLIAAITALITGVIIFLPKIF